MSLKPVRSYIATAAVYGLCKVKLQLLFPLHQTLPRRKKILPCLVFQPIFHRYQTATSSTDRFPGRSDFHKMDCQNLLQRDENRLSIPQEESFFHGNTFGNA